MKKLILAASAVFTSITLYAQETPKIKVSGYLEAYYGYDFDEPTNNTRPGFVYCVNRRIQA